VDIALEKVSGAGAHKEAILNYKRSSDVYAKRRRLHPFTGDTFIQAIILSAAMYNERAREREIMWAGCRLWWRPGELSRIIILCQDWLQLLSLEGRLQAGKGMLLHNYARHPTELCNCFGTFVARACLPSQALSTSGARSGQMDE
jgi:hypothetical protein